MLFVYKFHEFVLTITNNTKKKQITKLITFMYIILNKYKYVLFVLVSIDEKQKLAVVRLDNRKTNQD